MASILLVCTGNICRSPIAEAALRAKLSVRFADRAPHVSSAGVAGWEGSGAAPEAVQAAAERGLDVASHAARALTPSMLDQADLIVCMAAEHREAIRTLAPQAAPRTFTLKELVPVLEQLPPGTRGCRSGLARRTGGPGRGGAHGRHRHEPERSGRRRSAGSCARDFRAVAWEIDEHVARLVTGLYGPAPG